MAPELSQDLRSLQGAFSGARSSTVVRAKLSQFTPRKTHPVVVGAESEKEEDSAREKRMRLPLRTPSSRKAAPNQNRMSLKPS